MQWLQSSLGTDDHVQFRVPKPTKYTLKPMEYYLWCHNKCTIDINIYGLTITFYLSLPLLFKSLWFTLRLNYEFAVGFRFNRNTFTGRLAVQGTLSKFWLHEILKCVNYMFFWQAVIQALRVGFGCNCDSLAVTERFSVDGYRSMKSSNGKRLEWGPFDVVH